MTGHSLQRLHVPADAVADMEADGWRTVYVSHPNLRGADVLMERESVTVPVGQLLVLSVAARRRLDAYARAIGSTASEVVEGWIASIAPEEVTERARAVKP